MSMQALLVQGLDATAAGLDPRTPIDVEEARAREIEMNGHEARARAALLAANRPDGEALVNEIGVLELVDAYETAGNQLYRVAEALGESDADVATVAV